MSFTDSADTSDQDIDKYLMSKKPAADNSPGLMLQDNKPPTLQKGGDLDSEQISKILAGMPKPPKIPELPKPPSAPNNQYQSPFKEMSGPLLFLTTLASLMTRHPAQTAMNSFSAMVNANVKGQKEIADQAHQNFQDAMQATIEQSRYEIEHYKLLMDQNKNDVNMRLAKLMTMANGTQNVIAAGFIANGDMAGLGNYITDLDKRTTELDHWNKDYALKQQHENAFEGNAGSANEQARIDAIGQYRSPPISSSNRSPVNQRLMEQVYEQYPDYDATRYNAKNKATSAFATGKQGDTIRSMNVSISHLDTLEQLSKAMGNNDTKTLNRISNAYKEEFGNPAPGNFEAAKVVVGDEVVKAIIGAGGGVSDREEAKKNIDNTKTPAELAGVISTYKRLLGGQLEGLKKQYTDTTGRKDFDTRLTPEAQQQLNPDLGPTDSSGWATTSTGVRYKVNP